MANYRWEGAISTSASNASNWQPNGNPAAGDVIIFDTSATQDCVWDVTTPSGTTLSVDEAILETDFTQDLIIDQLLRIKGMFLGGNIASGGASDTVEFRHGASPNFFGSYKTYNERFLLIDGGTATGITMNMIGSTTPVTKFDDGAHPIVDLQSGRFAPDYVAPTGTSGKASFDSMTVTSPADFSPDSALSDNDRLKVFSFTAFAITSTSIDFGLSTVEYFATAGDFMIPTHGATGMPSGFQAYYRKIILKTNTAGHKCVMADNTFISVEEFEIDDGVVFKGPVTDTSQGSEIRSTKTPKVRGTWSFSQISPGIYRSPRHAAGPMALVNGNFHITGKLDVDGLIDPTGLELNPQSSNPGGVAANTLWLNSTDSNKLYLGSSEVAGGGGGGSGTVTSIATTAPITGGTITNTGTIGISAATTSAAGSMSAADKTKLDGIAASATAYADSDAISAVEGEATLDLTGQVTMAQDLKVAGVQYQQFKDLTDDLATGYHTIAVIEGRSGGTGSGTGGSDQRGIGTFLIRNTDSSRHQTIMFTASHLFGGGNGNGISVEHSSYFSTLGINGIRIREGATYDGAALQINIADATNNIEVYLKNNFQEAGWQLITPVADATDPSTASLGLGYNNSYVSFTPSATTSLTEIATLGQSIQGPLHCRNKIIIQSDINHDGSNIGFFGTTPTTKTAVAVLGSQTPAPIGPPSTPAPGEVFHADFDAAIQALNTNVGDLQSKLDALITSLSNLGLV